MSHKSDIIDPQHILSNDDLTSFEQGIIDIDIIRIGKAAPFGMVTYDKSITIDDVTFNITFRIVCQITKHGDTYYNDIRKYTLTIFNVERKQYYHQFSMTFSLSHSPTFFIELNSNHGSLSKNAVLFLGLFVHQAIAAFIEAQATDTPIISYRVESPIENTPPIIVHETKSFFDHDKASYIFMTMLHRKVELDSAIQHYKIQDLAKFMNTLL